MTERGICMTAPNTLAIRERRKTQTRRLMKRHPDDTSVLYHKDGDGNWIGWYPDRPGLAEFTLKAYPKGSGKGIKCPHGVPGDLLYVKETWCLGQAGNDVLAYYRADNPKGAKRPPTLLLGNGDEVWRSGRFMPKRVARTWLEITDVRVQQAQSISDEDAIAEGVEQCKHGGWKNYLWHGEPQIPRNRIDAWPWQFSNYDSAYGSFSSLWELIHGPGAWERNDWVFAISFELVEKETPK